MCRVAVRPHRDGMTENAAIPPTDPSTSTSESASQSATPTAPLFVRPREGRLLAGVCAGIAARWGLDVTLVRIATVVLALLSGVGVVVYVAAWLLTPSIDRPAPLAADSELAARFRGRGIIRRLLGTN